MHVQKTIVKNKKFKLPDMDFSYIINEKEDKGQLTEGEGQMKEKLKEDLETEIIINDVLTYDSIKLVIEQLLNANSISKLKCENIEEIDITGLQFLISVKKHFPKIIVETHYSSEINEFLKKTGCNFK